MALQISISNAIGARAVAGGGGVDPDAQAFITAASITDPTQQSAINTLVTDLKGYNIWTKMKALYPFCGSTASQHKWNLKDPRDLDVAFRLRFFGGTIHTANGVQGNALNAYYNTYLNANSLPISSNASGVYIRTDVAESGVDFGAINTNAYDSAQFGSRNTSNQYVSRWYQSGNTSNTTSNTDSRGFYQLTRRNSSEYITAKNTSKVVVSAPASSVIPSMPFYGLAAYFVPTAADAFHGSKQIAFHYFADSSMSNTELDNLYTAVQTFQVSLGRSIGTQTVSDADAQAFVTNAGIVDQVEANAVNNLVIGLKADGLWTKMKAVYPFVGGTSTTNKYNLKNPLDTDAAFRLVFSGGWTFSQTGALPNGTNAFADTKLDSYFGPTGSPLPYISQNDISFGVYSRTNSNVDGADISGGYMVGSFTEQTLITKYSDNNTYWAVSDYILNGSANIILDTRGLINVSRLTSATKKIYRNGGLISTGSFSSVGYQGVAQTFLLSKRWSNPTYSNRQLAFAYISNGLTDTDATNLYNRVQTFNTALARQV